MTIVVDRRSNELPEPCKVCPNCPSCEVKIEIASPIVVGGSARGVLVIAAFNDIEAEHIVARMESFKRFCTYFAKLIASSSGGVNYDVTRAFLDALLPIIPVPVLIEDGAGQPMVSNFPLESAWQRKEGGLLSRRDALPASTERRVVTLDGLTVGKITVYSSFPLFLYEKGFESIWGISPEIKAAKEQAIKIALSHGNVLVLGETGTGKELFARAIHNSSSRSRGPFIALNCASVPESLLESELFGYERGSFTGAKVHGSKGRIEMANGGTLFLDEIGEMPQSLQAKLLRFLQEKAIQKIGSPVEVPVDVRVIAATNRPLEELLKGTSLRKDLFYRLSTHCLELPPLRSRQGDIRYLAGKFLELRGSSFETLDPLVQKILLAYPWPGNVRELENCITHCICMSQGKIIRAEHLPAWIRARSAQNLQHADDVYGDPPNTNLQQVEADSILRALNRFGWSGQGKRKAANDLGIHLSTLYRKIKAYGLEERPMSGCSKTR